MLSANLMHVLIIMTSFPVIVRSIPTDEQRLLNLILDDYNPGARPVYNASHTVTVQFGLTLTQITDMVSLLCHIHLLFFKRCLFMFYVFDSTDRVRRKKQHRPHKLPDEQKLLKKLLDKYNIYSRPVYNASKAVVVKFGLTLTQIFDMVRFLI